MAQVEPAGQGDRRGRGKKPVKVMREAARRGSRRGITSKATLARVTNLNYVNLRGHFCSFWLRKKRSASYVVNRLAVIKDQVTVVEDRLAVWMLCWVPGRVSRKLSSG